jgi:hypothetical protein
MKKILVLSICLVLAIMAASTAPAYLTVGKTPHQTAIRQLPVNPQDRSLSPGNAGKTLYVPSCTIDSSLTGKSIMDKHSTGGSFPAGNSIFNAPPVKVEIGSLRCRA